MSSSQNKTLHAAPEKEKNQLKESTAHEMYSEHKGLLEIIKRENLLDSNEKISDECLVQNGFDRRILEILAAIYEIIDKDGYISIVSLKKSLKISSQNAWKILNFFEDQGCIYHDYALKIEKRIKGKFKIYVKTKKDYNTLIDINQLTGLKTKKD